MLKKDLEQELNRAKLILDYAREELKLKDNIIKEVREYLPKLRRSTSYEIDEKIDELDEILDKVEENK